MPTRASRLADVAKNSAHSVRHSPRTIKWLGLLVAGAGGVIACVTTPEFGAAESRPNILIVMADDMGFSDIGVTGGEIPTPNIDALAAAGHLFTNFHTAPTCSPTRAMLLTGVDHHQAGFGTLNEIATDQQRAQPGYEGFLNRRVATVAEVLKTAGYETLYSGKWHLGRGVAHLPSARGFDQTFSLLEGAGNHFDDRGYGSSTPKVHYVENGAPVTLPPDYYSSSGIADKFLGFLDRRETGVPFFGVLSFIAPHWPLQAPAEDIARHESRYQVGWDELRARRLSRQIESGIFPGTIPLSRPAHSVAAWSSLTPDERGRQARIMAIYAAMIENMDTNLGRVLAHLRATGELDNTVVIFLSDNGPEGRDISGYPFYADWLRQNFEMDVPTGTADSFVFAGRGWAQLSATPFRGVKGSLFEGATRVPLIVADFREPVMPAKHVTKYASVLDVAPTIYALAAGPQARAFYSARALLRPEGTSLLLPNADWQEAGAGTTAVTGLEYNGHSAVVRGRWKAIRAKSTRVWMLYDVEADPTERIDLAQSRPAVLQSMIEDYGDYARTVGVYPR